MVQEGLNSMCCMCCNPTAFDGGGRLDVLQVGKSPPRKKRRRAVRRADKTVVEAVKAQLESARAQHITENPSLAIVGAQFVCPDSVINSISSSTKFISVIEDMDTFCLRQELKQIFFDVLIAAVGEADFF